MVWLFPVRHHLYYDNCSNRSEIILNNLDKFLHVTATTKNKIGSTSLGPFHVMKNTNITIKTKDETSAYVLTATKILESSLLHFSKHIKNNSIWSQTFQPEMIYFLMGCLSWWHLTQLKMIINLSVGWNPQQPHFNCCVCHSSWTTIKGMSLDN